MRTRLWALVLGLICFVGVSNLSAEESVNQHSVPETAASSMKPKPTRRLSNYVGNGPTLNPSPETMEKMSDPQAPFNPYNYRNFVGFEGALPLGAAGTLSTSILNQGAVAFGSWSSPTMGYELYFGFSNPRDNTGVKVSTNAQGLGVTNKVETTTYGNQLGAATGTGSAAKLLLGAAFKYRIYQVKHFGVSTDFLATVTPKTTASYIKSGTREVNTADISIPTNYTVTETNIASVEDTTSWFLRFGPRVNIDYNFPYLPNLLLGFSAGAYVSVGGEQKTTTTTRNNTTAYVNDVAQTPTVDTTQVETITTDNAAASSETYALGGTGLNLTGAGGLIPISVVGTFRIRYTF